MNHLPQALLTARCSESSDDPQYEEFLTILATLKKKAKVVRNAYSDNGQPPDATLLDLLDYIDSALLPRPRSYSLLDADLLSPTSSSSHLTSSEGRDRRRSTSIDVVVISPKEKEKQKRGRAKSSLGRSSSKKRSGDQLITRSSDLFSEKKISVEAELLEDDGDPFSCVPIDPAVDGILRVNTVPSKKLNQVLVGEESPRPDVQLFHLLFELRGDEVLVPVISFPKFILKNLTKRSSKYVSSFNTRIQDNTPLPGYQLSSLLVLAENRPWDRRSYYLTPLPQVFTREVSVQTEFFTWVLIPKDWDVEGIRAPHFAFCYIKGQFVCWVVLTPKGYVTWEHRLVGKVKKKYLIGTKLDKLFCTKIIKKEMSNCVSCSLIPFTPKMGEDLIALDKLKCQNLQAQDVGVLYCPENCSPLTMKKLVSFQKDPPSPLFLKFLSVLQVSFDSVPNDNPEKAVEWEGRTVNLMLGPKMTKQIIRQKIGNAQCLIIFHDSETTSFEPHDLFLGQVSNFVCVVKPITCEDIQYWRVGFFVHYETKHANQYNPDTVSSLTKDQETFGEQLACFPPEVPTSFYFDDTSLAEFIFCKVCNARLHLAERHKTLRRQFELPLAKGLEDFLKSNQTPEWGKQSTFSF